MKVLVKDDQQLSIASPPSSSRPELLTENNNTIKPRTLTEPDDEQRDVRPKHSPSLHTTSPRSGLSSQAETRVSPSPHQTKPTSGTRAKSRQSSSTNPTLRSKDAVEDSPQTNSNRQGTEARPKLRAYMSKLALTDEPTAYERRLLGYGAQQKPPDSSALPRQTADSPLYRSVRLPKSALAPTDPLYRSMRWSKSVDN